MKINEIFSQFLTDSTFLNSLEFGDGNIHSTYFINSKEGKKFILQKFNDYVFKDPIGLMKNTAIISDHLSGKIKERSLSWKFPKFSKTLDGSLFITDEEGKIWRLMDYIDHDPEAGKNDMSNFTAGSSFGQFIDLLSDLPAEKIVDTIPNFHNLPFRLENFKKSINSTSEKLREEAENQIKALLDREEKMLTIPNLLSSGKLPIRLVHMDTKLDNILFDKDANPVAIIDLDTVMPGIVHSDFGDALRSLENSVAEDEPDLSKMKLRIDAFTDYTRGFASSLKNLLIPAEVESLYLAPSMFAYMQAVRFLSDYLDGNKYYNIKYPEHNMVRTLNQIHLLELMEEKEEEMRDIVSREFH